MGQNIITNIKDIDKIKDFSGRYFIDIVTATPLFLPLWFGNKLDLDKLLVYSGEDIEKHPELPDYNDLIRTGRIVELHICRTYDIYVKDATDRFSNKRLTKRDFDRIIAEFKEHGFNVTVEALKHNYSSWLGDLKSGFRDEQNGYHLFTPCGCNMLSFRATSINDRLDWQETYVA